MIKKILFLLTVLVFFVVGLVLHLRNEAMVTFSFPFLTSSDGEDYQLGLLLLGAMAVGMVLGALLTSFSLIKSKMVTKKAKRDLSKVEKEVENLRAIPTSNQA